MGFALFSLGEYSNMLLMSALNVILFFGGWFPLIDVVFISNSMWFSFKICLFVILFIWMRAALPRYRYNQLMDIGWKIFLPISISYLIFYYILSFYFLDSLFICHLYYEHRIFYKLFFYNI
jgi:NADH-quinone oxidoreductase subunit H